MSAKSLHPAGPQVVVGITGKHDALAPLDVPERDTLIPPGSGQGASGQGGSGQGGPARDADVMARGAIVDGGFSAEDVPREPSLTTLLLETTHEEVATFDADTRLQEEADAKAEARAYEALARAEAEARADDFANESESRAELARRAEERAQEVEREAVAEAEAAAAAAAAEVEARETLARVEREREDAERRVREARQLREREEEEAKRLAEVKAREELARAEAAAQAAQAAAAALSERSVETPLVHVATIATPGELSIPPASDLSVEPEDERFFSEGEIAHLKDDADDEWDDAPVNAKAKRKADPQVVERRARFARYVRYAVAGAAVLCLAAVGRTALVGRAAPSHAAASSLHAAPESRPVAEPAAVAVPVAEPAKAPEPAVAVAEPAKAAEPEAKAADPNAKAGDAVAATPSAPGADAPATDTKPAVATSDKTALEEKKDANRALDRGKLKDAIEAGERSVALDPTDGEAWLILGASYQAKGDRKEARRCYAACVKEAKKGPVSECRAMTRF